MSPSYSSSPPRGLAVNVGANSTLPGVRATLHPTGRFEYVPIPEREPVVRSVPTYRSLGLEVPRDLLDVPVHLDPSFGGHHGSEHFTYGDEHAVKARPLAELSAGDYVWFYASLEPIGTHPGWVPEDWGAFLIGYFRLAIDPVEPDDVDALEDPWRAAVLSNAHFARDPPDAEVTVIGDPRASSLLDRPVPLSAPAGGATPAALVTEHSTDSGRGPWWRRPLRFDPAGTKAVQTTIARTLDHPWSVDTE